MPSHLLLLFFFCLSFFYLAIYLVHVWFMESAKVKKKILRKMVALCLVYHEKYARKSHKK